ncbi:MAG: winged helix-turn-helix domain-containing protein [Candidatus Woesearchaeota archaeon]
MKRKRERLEVIHDILSTVQDKGEIGPTRLLQLSNLSPQMFREYMNELVKSGLLEIKEEKKKMYTITDKGYTFLERYKIFSNFVEELGLN